MLRDRLTTTVPSGCAACLPEQAWHAQLVLLCERMFPRALHVYMGMHHFCNQRLFRRTCIWVDAKTCTSHLVDIAPSRRSLCMGAFGRLLVVTFLSSVVEVSCFSEIATLRRCLIAMTVKAIDFWHSSGPSHPFCPFRLDWRIVLLPHEHHPPSSCWETPHLRVEDGRMDSSFPLCICRISSN